MSHEIVPTNKKGYQPLHDTVFSESSNICVRQQLVKLLKKHELQMIMNKQPQGHRCDLQILNKNVWGITAPQLWMGCLGQSVRKKNSIRFSKIDFCF